MLRVVCMDFDTILDILQFDPVKDSESLKSILLDLAIRSIEKNKPITVVFSKEPDTKESI